MSVKQDLIEIIAGLPENTTWEDVRYLAYVRSRVEAGLRDFAEGRTISHEQIKKEFGIE
jgi:hypothetical protein